MRKLRKFFGVLTGRRYQKGPEHKKTARVLTAVVLSLALAGFAAGIIITDKNSFEVGWGQQRTTFAFSISGKKLDMTVLGRKLTLDSGSAAAAGRAAKEAWKELESVRPAGVRMMDMLYHSVKKELEGLKLISPYEAFQKVLELL
jgi:hypothetical protein